jgi:hypothetical protein
MTDGRGLVSVAWGAGTGALLCRDVSSDQMTARNSAAASNTFRRFMEMTFRLMEMTFATATLVIFVVIVRLST